MQATARQSIQSLLRKSSGKGRGSRSHEDDGQNLHRGSVFGHTEACHGFGARSWAENEPQAHPEAAAINGPRNDLVPTPPHENELPGRHPSQIPIPFEGICEQARRSSLGIGHHLHPHGPRARLSMRGDGLAHPLRAGLGDLKYDGRRARARSSRYGALQLRESARDLQHRSGQPIYLASVDRKAGKDGHPGEHGRQGALDGQRVRRAVVEEPQTRGSVFEKLPNGGRGTHQHRSLDRTLQHVETARRTVQPHPRASLQGRARKQAHSGMIHQSTAHNAHPHRALDFSPPLRARAGLCATLRGQSGPALRRKNRTTSSRELKQHLTPDNNKSSPSHLPLISAAKWFKDWVHLKIRFLRIHWHRHQLQIRQGGI